jgi:hypothetical protein
MRNFLAALSLIFLTVSALAQGRSGGPGPVPTPWIVSGPTVSYNNGGVTMPQSVTGGTKGVGTINVSGGYYIGGVSITTLSAASITVGTTNVLSGTANGVFFNNAGKVGNTNAANNGVLVTSGAGAPSISTTLPTGLAMQTPASINLSNATALPLGSITGLGTGIATWLATPTSANLATAVFDETGSGSLVFSTNPLLVTPTIGVATATSINKVTITAPATSAVLTIANGKTLTASNTLTFTGTDGNSFAFPSGSDTVVTLGAAQTLTSKTITATSNVLGGVTMTLGSDATGDVYYRNASGFLTRLALGSNSNVLTISGGLPSWQAGAAAATINVATTTVTGTCSTLQLIYNNAGTTACQNIVSALTAGNGISISGTTNATVTNTGIVKVLPSVKFSASGTYTPTTGMIYAQIEVVGGGGAGGGVASGTVSGAGGSGGSGAYSRCILTAAQIGASKAITIGAAAAGGAAGAFTGATGADASLGTLCTAKGGVGGSGTTAPNQASAGAGGLASGGVGDIKFNGGGGSAGGGGPNTVNTVSGPGGNGFFGGGAPGTANNAGGINGTDCGGGGSGGASNNAGNTTGGNGAVGCVVITEFTNQ